MISISKTEPRGALVLRTAALWGTFVLGSRELQSGQSLHLGEGEGALVAKPDESPVSDFPIVAVGSGWELDARGATGGSVYLRGRFEDPAELGKSGARIPIVAGDYGVLQYGAFAVFFQFADRAPLPRQRLRIDLGLVLAFLFSVLTLGGSLMLLYLLFPDRDLGKPLELTSAEELEVKYHFSPPAPEEPAPGAEAEGEAGAQRPKPKKSAGQPKRAPGPARPRRERAKPAPGSSGPSSAMLEVMQGAVGKQVIETIGTISSVAQALDGLGSAGVVLGGAKGIGGLATGSGRGGGQGGHDLFGSGTLDTGTGTGAGTAGAGRGRAGKGSGGGRAGGGRGGERRLKAAATVAPGQGLGPEQIARVVRARAGAFRACYESAAARNPKLSGGITVSFDISPSGSVNARIASSSLDNARVESCVLRMFKRLRFPAADKATSANWPLVFRPGKR